MPCQYVWYLYYFIEILNSILYILYVLTVFHIISQFHEKLIEKTKTKLSTEAITFREIKFPSKLLGLEGL